MKKLLLLSAFVLFGSSWALAQSDESSVSPPNGMQELQAYSIFYENYKSESYEGAIRFGRWIWKGMPEKLKGYSRFDLKTNLNRLINMYSGLAEEVQDPSLKEANVDTALMIFDKMFERYADDKDSHYDWYIKRGRLLQTHSSVMDNASARAAESYYEAFQLKSEEFTKHGDGYYIQVMLQEMVSAGQKDQALAVIEKAEPFAPEKVTEYFDNIRNKLFDSPEERIAFLEKKRQENPKSIEVLTQLRDLYQDQESLDKVREVSQELYKLDPSYENTMVLANNAIENANYNEAIKYLKEAMSKASEDQKADVALKLSNAYLNKEELQAARKYARQARDFDSDWGKPYIQIADIYAQSVNQCTSNRKMEKEDKAVYWLVLDYLDRAKQVDAGSSSEVQRKYSAYEPVTPINEEKFFWEPALETGDKLKIDSSLNKCYGWINETTTVR